MSQDKDQKELISVTKNQALGVGGVSVSVLTLVGLTSTFLTANDGKLFQRQIDQNKASIQLLQVEIKEGFKEQGKALKEAVKDIEKVMRNAANNSWTRDDHDRYAKSIEQKIEDLKRDIEGKKWQAREH
jgi:uncharacterized membrane-anchored protein YhcB (DUF1043 family)